MGAAGEFEIDKGDGAGKFLLDDHGKFKICGNCCTPCICGDCPGWQLRYIMMRRSALLLDGIPVPAPVNLDYVPGDTVYDDLIRFIDRSDWEIYGGAAHTLAATPFGHLGWKLQPGYIPPDEAQYSDYINLRFTYQDVLGAGEFGAARVEPTLVEGQCQVALCKGILGATATAELRTSRWKNGVMLWQSVNAGLRSVFNSGAVWPIIVNLYLVRRQSKLCARGVLHLGNRDGLFTLCGSTQNGGWPRCEFGLGEVELDPPGCIPRCVNMTCAGAFPTSPPADIPFLRGKTVSVDIDVDYCSGRAPYCWQDGGGATVRDPAVEAAVARQLAMNAIPGRCDGCGN